MIRTLNIMDAQVLVFTFCILLTTVQCSDDLPLKLTNYLQYNPRLARELSKVNDPLGIIPPSHAGFITVDKKLGNHLFFWFFPAINGDPKAPLLVYLNGVPVESSMNGLLHENGPIRLTVKNGIAGYERWNKSWAETFSMLYIDNPVGVGFSYTESEEGYRVDQDGYAKDLYSFIVQFYKIFPEYYQRELYIGGESYAGKYASAFAYLLDRNIVDGKTAIKLVGIFVGAPYYDSFRQLRSGSDYFYNLGVISESQRVESVRDLDEVENRLQDPSNNVTSAEFITVAIPFHGLKSITNYDTQIGLPPQIADLMNSPCIKKAVHAGNRNFLLTNLALEAKMTKDLVTSNVEQVAYLMDKYKVIFYGGDYNALITSSMIEAALAATPWRQRDEYFAANRSVWKVNSELAGYFTRVGNFCRITLRHCGHNPPFDQPENTALMMKEFICKGCVE
ncbi:hypothetical protein Btru_047352 [Bulinus truncatus]|nr:hypothetical protein Btru_047352 [Bulinus truncatus]